MAEAMRQTVAGMLKGIERYYFYFNILTCLNGLSNENTYFSMIYNFIGIKS